MKKQDIFSIGKKLRKLIGKDLQEHVVLRDFVSLGVGGVADFFYTARTVDDLVKAVEAAWKLDIPHFVFGMGANVIVSDFGFPGLVIRNLTSNISFVEDKSQAIVDSGVSVVRLIMEAASKELSGLEPLIAMPGTIGGAVYGNAGAHGVDIGSLVKGLTVFLPNPPGSEKAGKIIRYEQDWLKLAYRSSSLKRMKSLRKPVILAVTLQLSRSKREDILERIKKFQQWRMEHQPIGERSAGSTFKNPAGTSQVGITGVKPPEEEKAAYLLDKSSCKKMKVGEARFSAQHANFLLNGGKATAGQFRQLIEQAREKVRQKFGVVLEEEIEYVGRW